MNILLKKILLLILLVLNAVAFTQDRTLQSIQQFLNTNYELLGLNKNDVSTWSVTDNFNSSNGIKHVHIIQTVNGIKVQNGTANITLSNNDSVLNIASNLIANLSKSINSPYQPSIDPNIAITYAAKHANMKGAAGKKIKTDNPFHLKYDKGSLSKEVIDVELAFWNDGKHSRLVWITSLYELNSAHWWQIFVDAQNGKELHRIDWVVSCDLHDHQEEDMDDAHPVSVPVFPAPAPPPPSTDQYNVFPLPVESPNHGSASVVTGPYNSTASPFGWHDVNGIAGEEYTITRGNNVYAYEDVNDVNSPGYSPNGGTSLNFNFPINLNQSPANYQDVAITNLFFTCNRIHDILYLYGFDEQSGNFQENNYGNGGAASDNIRAEAQDGGGTNNANFATPPDGSNPTMQMYLWAANGGAANLLTVNSPSNIAGVYAATEAVFGPGVPATPLTADLVLIDDGVAPDDDGCETAVNGAALSGKFAVIYRGSCTFVSKIENAQNFGAVGVIIINNVSGQPITMGGTSSIITIPSIMVSQSDGAIITGQMASGTVNATLGAVGSGSFDKDGDFDNGIVIHEFGHGVSNRLTGGPSNSGCLSNDEQMGEGWSDFLACMLTMDMTATNPVNRPIGTYATSQATNGNGIRNAPYDTSFVVNDYTYADVADVNNVSQPHGIGFVWATMLWDLNWAFIDQYGFDSNIETGTGGNNMVLELVIEGLKLQPCSPGFVDGRDAILLADQLLNAGANQCLIWSVFAKRGLGYSASQGSSNSRTDQTEAFDLPIACAIPDNAPIADFDADIYQTCSGEVQFQDLSQNTPQNWLWEFGDNTTDTVQNPLHVYTTSGLYTVKLTVTNSLGVDSLIIIDFIEVVLSDFNWNVSGLTVNFNATSVPGANFFWDFGDNNTATSQNPSNTYPSSGIYEVTLQVNGGCTVTYDVTVEDDLGQVDLNMKDFEIFLFPNPASEEVNFAINEALASDALLQIYSVDGKLVESLNFNAGTKMMTIPLNEMSAQVYYLVLNYQNGVAVKKLIVQK